MGFLSNLLKQAEAQINMRDGGKTAATVRQQQQRPQAAQLPSPGQASSIQQPQRSNAPQVRVMPTISPLHIQQPSIQHQSFQQPHISLGQPGQTQGIRVGNQVVQQAQQAHTSRPQSDNNVPSLMQNILHNGATKNPVVHAMEAVGLGVARSAVGTVQSGAGLYDLARPGGGTNRVSKLTTQYGKNLDQAARSEHVNPALYHGAQAATDLAQFAVGGGELKAAAKAAETIPKVGSAVKAVAKISPFVEGKVATALAPSLERGNVGQRLVARGIQNIAKPGYQAANAAFMGTQLGKEAAHGQQITPGNVAQNLAIGGLGFPAAGAVAHEALAPVANKVLPAVERGVQTLKDNRIIAPSRLSKDEVNSLSHFVDKHGSQMDPQTYQQGVAAAQKAGIHPGDVQSLQKLVDAHAEYQGNRIKFNKPLDSVGAGMVTDESGSTIPTIKKLVGGKTQLPKNGKPTTVTKAADAAKAMLGDTQASAPRQTPRGSVMDALNKDATAPEAPAAKPAVQSQPKAAPTKVPGEQAGGIAPGNSTPQVVQNSLTKGAKEGRQNISDETIAQTSGEHTVRNTQKLADDSQKAVDSVPINTAVETAHGMLAQPLGHVSDEQTGYIAKAIERADAEATQARAAGNHVEADRLTRESSALHDGLSEHAVARGQANQALTMMYNKSPQGLFYGAIRDLKKAGVKDTPELRAKLQPLIDAVKTAKGEAEKADALANFHQAVSQTMPQNIGDKAIGIWKAGLLSGVKTQQGNAISNAVFAGLKKVSDVPATVVDSLMSVFTGERTKTATGTGGLRGTVEGASNGAHTMKTGVDRRNAGDKYEQHAEINFKHPALNKTLGTAVRTVFRGMNAADQPFWYGAFKNSMYDQAKADGINKGLGGQALRDHMDNLVANPTDKMANTALTEANKSTLNYDTLASKAIQAIHTGIDKVQSLNGRPVPQQARTIAHNVIHVLAPFVRVPTAFLSRTVDFTPLGMGKEVMQQVFTKQFDQRALSQAIGEGMTGTGAIALGIALTHNNLLSGDYPKNNPKEAQRWKAEGIQPNSVKIYRGKDANGKNRYTWISLNYMGPLGMLFGAGNKLATSDSPSALAKVGVAVGGMGQSLMGQSFLQGFSGFSDAIQDPNRNLKSFVNSQAGSVVPSIVNDVANATDSMQRQADNMGEAIKNRIPGLREQQNAKQDVYGNPLKQPAGPLGTLLGFKPSNDLTVNNPVTTEVGRLHMVDPSNSDMAVTPMPVSGTITAEKQKITLTDKQRYDLQKQVGQTTQTAWGKLIATPEYRAMNDQQKAKALTDIRGKASEDAQRAYVVANNLGTYNKPESKGADKVSQGDVVGALSKSKGSGSTTTADYNSKPDAQYKAALDSYNKNKSTMNDAQRIKAETSLHKLEIGSKYDKNVRDLYGMSKAQAYNYVSKSPNGKAIADQLTAYDNALYDAGLTSYRKYSNGIAPAAKKTSSGTRKSSGSRASSNSPTKALASYAKFGSSNAFKYENSLRGLVAKTLKAPKVKGTNQTARVKKYKAPSVKIATNPKPRKAFA